MVYRYTTFLDTNEIPRSDEVRRSVALSTVQHIFLRVFFKGGFADLTVVHGETVDMNCF